MALNQALVGKAYPAIRYEVGREKLREFAIAVGETDPIYHDEAAARAAGHPDLPAVPTFAVVLSLRAGQVVYGDPDLGLDYSRVVHGEQEFVYHRPIRAGDPAVAGHGAAAARERRMRPHVDLTRVQVGDALPEVAETIERLDLIRYAGASGDFNPIHWSDEIARAVGLPGVIAHGMYSMAVAARMVSGWAGDPAAIKRLKVRFSAMIEPGQTLTAKGEVAEVDDGRVLVRFHAEDEKGEKVLSKGEAELEL